MEARDVATGSPRFTEGAGVARRPRSRLVRHVALALATLALATLALAARADAYVYWTDGAKDTIGRANLDGTGVDRSFIRGLVHPAAMAVDTTHGYLYWVSANPVAQATRHDRARQPRRHGRRPGLHLHPDLRRQRDGGRRCPHLLGEQA